MSINYLRKILTVAHIGTLNPKPSIVLSVSFLLYLYVPMAVSLNRGDPV